MNRFFSTLHRMRTFNLSVLLLAALTILISGTETAMAATLVDVQQLTDDSVFHFVYSVPVGEGTYDVIRVHRVVKVEGTDGTEGGPAIADIETEEGVFLIHGSGGGFSFAFLGGEFPSAESDDQSNAVFLARRNIDVWGIDLAWSLVPFGTQDFAFMADWGMQRQVDEVLAGLDLAREVRGKGMGVKGQIHLLGLSLGGALGYPVLNADTESPCSRRRVKGYVSVGNAVGASDPIVVQAACTAAANDDQQIASGVYQSNQNLIFSTIGNLARLNPTGPSPFAPGLTNEQFALVVLALPGTGPPGAAARPFYHLATGVFDSVTGLPVDLVHLTPELAFDIGATGVSGFVPLKLRSDEEHWLCGDVDVPFDDRLDQVTVPVLYVGADGGFGDTGVAGLSLLGSTDLTVEIVDLAPPGQELFDYGHVDLNFGRDAGVLVWETIADWIRDHDDNVCR